MISVCLSTFNGEKYIYEQIQSILLQLDICDELIISDDNSTDKTIEIIQSFNDNRIKLFKNSVTKGVLLNVENALLKSTGDVIFLADQDDIWLPDKVQKFMKGLEQSDLIVSDCFIVDANLKHIEDSFFRVNNSQTNKWNALLRNSYLGCCMAFNRKVLIKALPFPAQIPMHDIWIGNIAAFYFKAGFINDKLIYYRRHGGNVSTSSEPSRTNLFQKLYFRFSVVKELIKRFN